MTAEQLIAERCAMTIPKEDEWADWTDEQLAEYESDLYERETRGEDTWELRNEVLWEMNRRGMMDRGEI